MYGGQYTHVRLSGWQAAAVVCAEAVAVFASNEQAIATKHLS